MLHEKNHMTQKRYLGLDLSGAKNSKTSLSVLEYFPKEKKVFLLDVHLGIGADEKHDADQVLIETILDHAEGGGPVKIGVNVPLSLPPCITCIRKSCPTPSACGAPDAKWMRNFMEKVHAPRTRSKKYGPTKFFTPYTQRPVELWIRHEVLSKIPEKLRFDLDETLGGNKAPLTARMHFLKHHLHKMKFREILPKLSVVLLMQKLKLNTRTIRTYRQLDDGAYARQTILEKMSEYLDIFIYDRDMKKLTQNLGAFDSFICAYTSLLSDLDQCVPVPKTFPNTQGNGWIEYPKFLNLDQSSEAE